MAIKNNQSVGLTTLQQQLEIAFPNYDFEINGNALTAILNIQTKLNIVEMGEEYWVVEAVPFTFKMVVVVVIITIFAYWVQMQNWHWGINIGLYLIAFIALGYMANFLYGFLYRNNYKEFKPAIIEKVKELVETKN